MIKFLRISSIYSGFLKNIGDQIEKTDSYEKVLKDVFEKKYSVSNNITKELNKKNYECAEIIHNLEILQKKWLRQYGDINSKEEVIFQQIKYYNPDVLFIGDVNLLSNKFTERVRSISSVKLILCFHCAPFSKKNLDNLKFADALITCTAGYRKKLKNLIKNDVFLMHHAFQNDLEINFEEKRDFDVGFLGSLFLNENLHIGRVSIIYNLIKNFNNSYVAINFSKLFILDFLMFILNSIIKLNFFKNIKIFYKIIYIFFFSKKPTFGKNMFDVLKNTKILINKHIEDTEYAGNMRLFEGTGLGCLLITDYKKDLEKLFNINNDIVIYASEKQILEKINYYLKNNSIRISIAKSGYNKTKSFHNYLNRVNELDKFIKKKLKNENL
jgi:spore maturation protein CgeB